MSTRRVLGEQPTQECEYYGMAWEDYFTTELNNLELHGDYVLRQILNITMALDSLDIERN